MIISCKFLHFLVGKHTGEADYEVYSDILTSKSYNQLNLLETAL